VLKSFQQAELLSAKIACDQAAAAGLMIPLPETLE
jgi:hypothetical protein